jgi:hypothetical protein
VNVVVGSGADAETDADEGIEISIGSSCFVSLMEITIFSKSIGVICFSFPRLRPHSVLASDIELMRGATGDDVSNSSSDDAESKLEERAGRESILPADVVVLTGFDDREGSERRMEEEEVVWVGLFAAGAQQNVSRFHSRQLRFSSRLPSSIACDVFENNDHCIATS